MTALEADAVRAAVGAYYTAINDRDIDAILPLFAPDAVMRDPVGSPPATDDTTRRQRYGGIAQTFETFAITPHQVVAVAPAAAAGAEAAARWTISGRTRNGREVTFDGISTFTFDAEGRITQMSAYWDLSAVMSAMQQS